MHIRQSLRAALQGSLQTRGARRGGRAGTAVYVLAQMRPSQRRRPCLPCRLCRRRALQHRRAPTVASSTRRANAAARLLRCGPARSATSARPRAKTVGRHAPPRLAASGCRHTLFGQFLLYRAVCAPCVVSGRHNGSAVQRCAHGDWSPCERPCRRKSMLYGRYCLRR